MKQAPRYRKIDGHWYVLKSHMAEQLQRAILSAFMDGLEHAERPPVERIKAMESMAQ